MDCVYFDRTLFPEEFAGLDLNSKSLNYFFSCPGAIPFFVKKGETIVHLSANGTSLDLSISAPYDCIVDRSNLYDISGGAARSKGVREGELFFKLLTENEYIDSCKSQFSMESDEITGEKAIICDSGKGPQWLHSHGFALKDYKAIIALGLSSGLPALFFRCSELRKYDTVHFLFEDKTVLSYVVQSVKSSRGPCDKEAAFRLTENDLEVMQGKALLKARIDSPRDTEATVFCNSVSGLPERIRQELFMKYARDYGTALKAFGLSWPEKEREGSEDGRPTAGDPCYVYLMTDTTNGFHKIGISNRPEYREGTLQSEKPTIELVCTKQYPSRAIASAIESALHAVYAGKRLRGEWFELSERDLEDIKLTLK